MSFMLNALNGSIQAELVRFFNVIDDSYLSTKSVSTTAFCKARSHSAIAAVRLSQLDDVKNNITLDLQVESHSTGEREMALKHLNKTQTGDLVVYDRGYPAVFFINTIC
jgi:hypothetical protein